MVINKSIIRLLILIKEVFSWKSLELSCTSYNRE